MSGLRVQMFVVQIVRKGGCLVDRVSIEYTRIILKDPAKVDSNSMGSYTLCSGFRDSILDCADVTGSWPQNPRMPGLSCWPDPNLGDDIPD